MLHRHKPLLLSMWLGVLFLVRVNNPDHGLLLELHTLTQAAHSYVLLKIHIYDVAITTECTTVSWVHKHCSSQRRITTVQPAEVTTWVSETPRKVLHVSSAGVLRVQPAGVSQIHAFTISSKSAYEWAARVRSCNSVKFGTSRNLPPLLKVVTHTGHAA